MNFFKLISTASFITALSFTSIKGMDPDSSFFHMVPADVFEKNILQYIHHDAREALQQTSHHFYEVITKLYPRVIFNELEISDCSSIQDWIITSFGNSLVIIKPLKKENSDIKTSIEIIDIPKVFPDQQFREVKVLDSTTRSVDQFFFQVLNFVGFKERVFAQHKIVPGELCNGLPLTTCPNGFYINQFTTITQLTFNQVTFTEPEIEMKRLPIEVCADPSSMTAHDKKLMLIYNRSPRRIFKGLLYLNLENENQPKFTCIKLPSLGIVKTYKDIFITSGDGNNGGFYLIDPTVDGLISKRIQYPDTMDKAWTHNYSVDNQQDALASYACIDGYSYHYYITNISQEKPSFKKIKFLPSNRLYKGQGMYLKGRYLFSLNCPSSSNKTLFTIYDVKNDRIMVQKNLKVCTIHDFNSEIIMKIGHMLCFPCYFFSLDQHGNCKKDNHKIMAINIKSYLDEENQVSQ